jgi:3',5'-cyclic AMP phosphodiesterase CpdA
METLRIGLVTDAHYADTPDRADLSFRMSSVKLAEAVEFFHLSRCPILINLGDLKDLDESPDPARSREDLSQALRILKRSPGSLFHLIGNHDIDVLSKAEAMALLREDGRAGCGWWSHDLPGLRLVGLDACFRPDESDTTEGHKNWTDATLPERELSWLAETVKTAPAEVIVFCHQRLDPDPRFCVTNAARARSLLEASGRVRAVIQGHDHRGAFQTVGGIPYVTLPAMVGGPDRADTAFAVLEISRKSWTLDLRGRAPSRRAL